MGTLSCVEWLGWGSGGSAPTTVIASGAMASICARKMDCFASLDDGGHTFTISRLDLPEACYRISLPSSQRAQGMPGARCTRGLVCNR